MLKRLTILLMLVWVVGCVRINPRPSPTPPPPPAELVSFDIVSVPPVSGATYRLNKVDGTRALNADGFAYETVPADIFPTELVIDAPGFEHFDSGPLSRADLLTNPHNFFHLVPLAPPAPRHVDPSLIPLEQLAHIRGAMWPLGAAAECGPVPGGPRPGQLDNVIATDFFSSYTPAQQDCIIKELKSRGYTHVVLGPLVDSDGYHGMWPPRDWRGANFNEFLDLVEKFWDNNLAPVVFIHPDGWTFEQTRDEFTPLLSSARAQRLLRLVVPGGWEPTRYDWSSCTWALYGQWARSVLPGSLVLLHTVSDVDAPVGTDERCDDNGKPNAEGWARVAPWFHGWLTQSAAFERPLTAGDANHPDRTNFQNWTDLFNPDIKGSYQDRFQHGYAGWPTVSAWGDRPLKVYAGEYSAYWRFWAHRTEAEALTWGDAAMKAGADGYLDGGTVEVPLRH